MSRTIIPGEDLSSAAIGTVERETGLSKDTLRVWERRYGFPVPFRNSNGVRVYPRVQVEKLRIIRRLMDQGLRPAKLVTMPLTDLIAWSSRNAGGPRGSLEDPSITTQVSDLLDEGLQHLRSNDVAALRELLALTLLQMGPLRFVIDLAGPLNERVGDAWARGDITVSQEHLYTEQMQHLLREAAGSAYHAAARPAVLLTTLPGETHQLGSLMAHVCLAAQGARCISLGVQTPAEDIAQAARDHQVDIVGLSFSEWVQIQTAYKMLADLRGRLDSGVEIWAGGSIWRRARKSIPGVTLIASLTQIPAAILEHRAQRSHTPG